MVIRTLLETKINFRLNRREEWTRASPASEVHQWRWASEEELKVTSPYGCGQGSLWDGGGKKTRKLIFVFPNVETLTAKARYCGYFVEKRGTDCKYAKKKKNEGYGRLHDSLDKFLGISQWREEEKEW